jgi:hypothetical protein
MRTERSVVVIVLGSNPPFGEVLAFVEELQLGVWSRTSTTPKRLYVRPCRQSVFRGIDHTLRPEVGEHDRLLR